MSFVCLGAHYSPRSIDDCPDTNPVDGEERHLFSLVTQAGRGEVALVDLTSGTVVDDEPTVPGFNFLPVGNAPTSIASTPGGLASFVGVSELGKEGIFALPSSCIGPRPADDHVRDFTMWPACRLPSAPGDMTVLIDHLIDDDGDASTPPVSQCAPPITTVTSEERAARDCPADLSLETKLPGRRMLAVTLPSTGEVAIIDAQALLDRDPGSFDACPIQRLLPLRVDLPKVLPSQKLPPDLDLPGATHPVGVVRPAPSESYAPKPAGISLLDDPRTGEQRLFLADQDAPVVHVLDAKNPCAVVEKPPLLPMSFVDPTRVVTTKKVATSPLTSEGQRYLYAIDDLGGVMIFDVGTAATDRTPLLRPRSAILPYEDPDRISFNAPAKDVTFALQDKVEVDPATGSQRVGVFCDPDPGIDPSSPPALYRPAPDYTSGAAPSTLRGVFGFIALSSGQVAVIDVEDFDEKCRRPIVANPLATEDFRGCSGDPNLPYFTIDPASPTARFTVTNEASCHTVEPNRARSSVFVFNDTETGVRAPALRLLPTLLSDTQRTLVTDATEEGKLNPKILGVNFSKTDRAQVYVGATLLAVGSLDSPLLIDPTTADQNSVVLDVHDPRTYLPQETFFATFEGSLLGERTSAQFSLEDGQASLADGQNGDVLCNFGIEDASLAKVRGGELGVAKGDLSTFADSHADYVRITSDLLDEDDAYWLGAAGARCGGANADVPGGGFLQCRSLLGTRTAMGTLREFEITQASTHDLSLTPRRASAENKDAINALVHCCFPQAVSYEVRAANTWVVTGSASGYRHAITANPDTDRCEIDTNPLRSRLHSRAYEISCDPTSANCSVDGTKPSNIGLAQPGADGTDRDVACIVQNPATDAQFVGQSPCIYSGLSSTFAIYRGQSPSVRDYQFRWDVIGGFSPLLVNLAVASDPNSNPQSMKYSPELGELVIADGASKGLVVISLSTFASQYFY